MKFSCCKKQLIMGTFTNHVINRLRNMQHNVGYSTHAVFSSMMLKLLVLYDSIQTTVFISLSRLDLNISLVKTKYVNLIEVFTYYLSKVEIGT